jgi:hypothetical protein
VGYPTGNAIENGTDGTKGNADRKIQLQSDYSTSDNRRVKDGNVDSPRNEGTHMNNFSIEDRDENSIINFDLAVKSDIVPR